MEECIICFDETSDFIFYRCAHKVCANCYPKLKTCPFCNTPFEVPREGDTRIIEVVVQREGESRVVARDIAVYHLIFCGGIALIILLSMFYYHSR